MQDVTNHQHLERVIVRSYANAYAYHGDLDLVFEAFSSRLYSIIEQRLGTGAPDPAASEFVNRLHLNDLYLALACAQGSADAWDRFVSLYTDSIRRVCKYVCPSNETARELADSLPGQLFLPSTTGCPRISSYRGFSPLPTWLAAIIKHFAINERCLKFNNLENLDLASSQADESSIYKTEAAIRADRYEQLIRDSLQGAVSLLTDRERFILCLRYEQQMQVSQVALLLGVRPPAISRQLDRTRQKLRKQVILILSTKHRLGPAVIQDCLIDIVENPEHLMPTLS